MVYADFREIITTVATRALPQTLLESSQHSLYLDIRGLLLR